MVDMENRRKLLLTMLDAVYVDTLEEKAIVGIQPKPAFLPLFEVAAAGEDRDVALFSGTSVVLGFGYSEDMHPASVGRGVPLADGLHGPVEIHVCLAADSR